MNKLRYPGMLLLLVASAYFISSCHKTVVYTTAGLIGKWEQHRAYGGLTGLDTTFKFGNGNTFQFNADSTYAQFVNSKFYAKGKFSILKNTQSGFNFSGILLLDNQTNGPFIKLDGATLTIGALGADQIAIDYVKIK